MALRKWADLEACCCNVDANLQYGGYLSGYVGLVAGIWEMGIGG